MRLRALAVLSCVLLAACAGSWSPRARAAANPAPTPSRPAEGSRERAATARPRARGGGVAPGDERGPGRFVSRGDEKSFYAASGGQFWYYLNLYYWAPEGLDTRDLWIREEVVEQWKDLRRHPDGAPAPDEPAKVTREYWEVGSTGRTVGIDNHKDFFRAAEEYCAGTLEVTMTLELGRAQIRDPNGEWVRPRAPYVLDEKNYGPGPRKGKKPSRFERLPGEPATVWTYRIPWSSAPNRLVRSVWEDLRVPALEFVRRFEPTPAAGPVVTDTR